MQQFFKIAV